MAPIEYPSKGRQTFTIKGEGSFTLTEEQRGARSLLITVEKIKTGFIYDYFNFSTPEPNTHWGYLQLMARDFVIETQQLEYRRQVVKFWDNINLDPIEQLRCLVRKTARFMFELGLEISPIEVPENATEVILWELFAESVEHPRIIPTQLMTSIWYKIDIGRSAFVTIDWQGYALTNCEFTGDRVAPSGEAPRKGESGPGSGAGGGGTRPKNGPPPGQNGDPSSDSPGPSPGIGVPPSPGEQTGGDGTGVGGQTKVVWGNGTLYNDNGCNTEAFGPVTVYIPGDIVESRLRVGASDGNLLPGFCGGDSVNRAVWLELDGLAYDRSYGPAKFTVVPTIISVEYIP